VFASRPYIGRSYRFEFAQFTMELLSNYLNNQIIFGFVIFLFLFMGVFKQVFSRLYVSAALMLQCRVQGHREFSFPAIRHTKNNQREFPGIFLILGGNFPECRKFNFY